MSEPLRSVCVDVYLLTVSVSYPDLPSSDVEYVKSRLVAKNISFVAQRDIPDSQIVTYFFCRTVTNVSYIVEIKFKQGVNACKITVKSPNRSFSELCVQTVKSLIEK